MRSVWVGDHFEIEEETLLAWYRARLAAWPPQVYRVRAALRAREEAEGS